MAERIVRLSLSGDEVERLAGLGVTADARGVLRSASGREVTPGVAASLLSKAGPAVSAPLAPAPGITPAGFQRAYLREGHAAESAGQWTAHTPPHGHDELLPQAAHPAGREDAAKGKRGRRERKLKHDWERSGRDAEEAAMAAPPRDDAETVKTMSPGRFERGYLREGHQAEGPRPVGGVPAPGAYQGAAEKARLDPEDFHRRYLAAGHSADSPSNTGTKATAPMPQAHPAEPQDFGRGWLRQDHQAPSPGDQQDNSPLPPGSPGADVYHHGATAYGANQRASVGEHVAQTGGITSAPARPQWSPPAALGAANVPHGASGMAALTGRAPGER